MSERGDAEKGVEGGAVELGVVVPSSTFCTRCRTAWSQNSPFHFDRGMLGDTDSASMHALATTVNCKE